MFARPARVLMNADRVSASMKRAQDQSLALKPKVLLLRSARPEYFPLTPKPRQVGAYRGWRKLFRVNFLYRDFRARASPFVRQKGECNQALSPWYWSGAHLRAV